jgi:hypothetical protein
MIGGGKKYYCNNTYRLPSSFRGSNNAELFSRNAGERTDDSVYFSWMTPLNICTVSAEEGDQLNSLPHKAGLMRTQGMGC